MVTESPFFGKLTPSPALISSLTTPFVLMHRILVKCTLILSGQKGGYGNLHFCDRLFLLRSVATSSSSIKYKKLTSGKIKIKTKIYSQNLNF